MRKNRLIIFIAAAVLIALLLAVAGKTLAGIINSRNQIVPERSVIEAAEQLNSTEINGKRYSMRNGIETYLLIGLDSFGLLQSSDSYYNKDQADYLMLVSIDSDNKKVNFLTINRDTICNVKQLGIGGKSYGTALEQIALSHTYGDGMYSSCENTLDAVSGLLFGTKIDYYAAVTMDGVTRLNDYIGGVCVDDELLLGDEALSYVRGRIGVDDSTNIARMQRQNKYMTALIDKIHNTKLNASYVEDAIKVMGNSMLTNVDLVKVYDILDRISTYEFGEIKTPGGKADYSGEYARFYVDEQSLSDIVIEMFYK